MRLTVPLFLFKLPNGHLFRGKYRLVKKVTRKAVMTLRQEYEVEERNMFYLRHPYLTPEQTAGYMKAYKEATNEPSMASKYSKERHEKFEKGKNRTLEDQLAHLKVAENWEFHAGSN